MKLDDIKQNVLMDKEILQQIAALDDQLKQYNEGIDIGIHPCF